ncbi:MAG: PEGA domain-containing protein [Chitinivibrionales bacterium]|nr:PEGA domain-containing protein [Chitinivibrionales bacterium]
MRRALTLLTLTALLLSCSAYLEAMQPGADSSDASAIQSDTANSVATEECIARIFISSIPPIADIYMDGRHIGQTNMGEVCVTPGEHQMRFVKDGKTNDTTMTFTTGKNGSRMVRIR